MSRRFISARAHSAILAGTLASAMLATSTSPVLLDVASVASASPRNSPGQSISTERKKGRKNHRNVTKTFDSDAAISIPDPRLVDEDGQADTCPSRVAVAGLRQGKVLDVNLTLRGFSHTFPGDVDLVLVAPNGAQHE